MLIVNGFICATWSIFTETPGWLSWQFVPGMIPVIFIAITIIGFRYTSPLMRVVYSISAAWVGALNYFFFAAVACWILGGIDLLAGWPLQQRFIGEGLFGLALVTSAYGLINAAWIRVSRVEVRLRNLPEAWQGRTVALVTDMHLGHHYGPGFVRRVLAKLRNLHPDAVLISGDMFDGTPIGLDRLVSGWSGYSAPRGIFFVGGNHDEFAERDLYLNAVARTGIRVLNNEKVIVDGLQIVGAHDSEAGDATALRGVLREARLDAAQPSILLAHRPENLAVSEEEGVSLQLSGHTHGGQVWPWNILVTRIYGRFAHGLNHLGKLQVYTSYGVGTWGPPLRVGTNSEIVLIRFTQGA